MDGAYTFGSGPGASRPFQASYGSRLSYLADIPSLSSISNPNVAVAFKNLLKKDPTTKLRALEALVSYVKEHPSEPPAGGVEDPVLEMWVQLYPRASIDNDRRVREVSHTLQLALLVSTRKRMEKHLPRTVGPWLAGLSDSYSAAARAAADGLATFLNTAEKRDLFWRRCRPHLLAYAADALCETQETLSNERITTQDDAKAIYARVVAVSLGLVCNVFARAREGIGLEDGFRRVLRAANIWDAVASPDPAVRRAICHLVVLCLDNRVELGDLPIPDLKNRFLLPGLKSSQAGSALEFVAAMTRITESVPDAWAASSESQSDKKKTASKLLLAFIEKGSQGSSAVFWTSIADLLSALPSYAVSPTLATLFLAAIREGITRKEEPKGHASLGWTGYINTLRRFIDVMPGDVACVGLFEVNVFPLFDQYLFPVDGRAEWTVGALGPTLLASAHDLAVRNSNSTSKVGTALAGYLDPLSVRLMRHFAEASRLRESEAYQESVSAVPVVLQTSERWFSLAAAVQAQRELLSPAAVTATKNMMEVPSRTILAFCAEHLHAFQFQPFGLAAVLARAGELVPRIWLTSIVPSFLASLEGQELAKALRSPASPHLFACLHMLPTLHSHLPLHKIVWLSWLDVALGLSDDDAARPEAITSLMTRPIAEPEMHRHAGLQEYVLSLYAACGRSGSGMNKGWPLFEIVVSSAALSDSTISYILRDILSALDRNSTDMGAIRALGIIASRSPAALTRSREIHTDVFAAMLRLTETNHEADVDPTKLAAVRAALDTAHTIIESLGMLSVTLQSLENTGPKSVKAETLAQQATHLFKAGDLAADELFPDLHVWSRSLGFILIQDVNPACSIYSGLGGAPFLVRPPFEEDAGPPRDVPRDPSGLSEPARIAVYAAELFKSGIELSALSRPVQVNVSYLLSISADLAYDQTMMMAKNMLWHDLSRPRAREQAEDLIRSGEKVLQQLMLQEPDPEHGDDADWSLILRLTYKALEAAQDLIPLGLYSARLVLNITREVARCGGAREAGFRDRSSNWHIWKVSSATVLPALAILRGYSHKAPDVPSEFSVFANRLLSELAVASVREEKTVWMLMLLAACVDVYHDEGVPAPPNRIIFAVRRITSWIDAEEAENMVTPPIAAEMCYCLRGLLKQIIGVHGPYWRKALDLCVSTWSHAVADEGTLDRHISTIEAGLLLSISLSQAEDPSHDLAEALALHSKQRSGWIIKLLLLPREGQAPGPVGALDRLLLQEAGKIPLDHIGNFDELYDLLKSGSTSAQLAGFHLLHRAMPKEQEKWAVKTLLEDEEARLPSQLLSLLQDPPTLERFPDSALARFPAEVRGYLFAWHLVFDAFAAAPQRLRGDYVGHLHSEGHVPFLLAFMFDVLGHTAAHPIDLDKESLGRDRIRCYDARAGEDGLSPESNMNWLLVHLCYRALKYLSSPFRAWLHSSHCSKQTRPAVETWIARWFSPLLVEEVLDAVSAWATGQDGNKNGDGDDGEQKLAIKVSRAAREITASYDAEDSTASILVRIPDNHPIENITVEGVKRVGASEKKWRSWVMNTMGVIKLSNGDIVEGLIAFQRNIAGALKRQTECAICYSIIAPDGKVPDKQCTTCKHFFHMNCLFKWFNTSSSNTCPLCRCQIAYAKIDRAKGNRKTEDPRDQ